MTENKEIFLEDLKEEIQREVLDFMNLKNEAEGNLDITPLFILENTEDNRKDNNESPYKQD